MLELPAGCPNIPDSIAKDNLVAIVVVSHKDAHEYNHNSSYTCRALIKPGPSSGSVEPSGSRIYLHRNSGRPTYSFGKGYIPESDPSESEDDDNPARQNPTYDVFLPIHSAAKQLFELVPDREAGSWRIDATSTSVVTVAGVELQKPQAKVTPKKKNTNLVQSLPHSVYLNASAKTVITYGDTTIKLWLIQSPSDVLRSERNFKANVLHEELQNVEDRTEDWAQNPYIWDRRTNPVSSSSWKVTQRFTGKSATAKVYQGVHGIDDRDREMLMFSKANNHSSIVSYHMATELQGVPAAITDTHQGFISFAALEPNLPSIHPGVRCTLAADMFRPLFSVLEWLHCNRIIHASVAPPSVLVQLTGDRLTNLLLVDYSNACIVEFGENMPQELMRHEGAQAMAIIEICSNIWQLRHKPLPGWKEESTMAQLTEKAEAQFYLVRQECDDFFRNRNELWQEEAGAVMLEFLALRERTWAQAREAQINNPELLQVGSVTQASLRRHVDEWNQVKRKNTAEEDSVLVLKSATEHHPMILSLGHAYLDGLLNPVCSAKIYPLLPLPHEICNKLRTLEGEDHEPWQVLRVEKANEFAVQSIGRKTQVIQVESRSLAEYLAASIAIHPAIREAVLEEYNREITSNGSMILPEFVETFHEQLEKRVKLSKSMKSTLEALGNADTAGTLSTSETFEISYHRPSQMFNVTQLHRVATINRLKATFSDPRVGCSSFVEVRGQPNLEGNYVPIEMLPVFAEAFGITVLHQPELGQNRSMYNPSDFSRNTGRIVLAHERLVAYASMSRKQSQVTHCPKDESDFQGSENFLSTYFGDWKVLPKTPDGMHEYPRPEHWAKFKTAEETETELDASKRKKLQPRSVSSQSHCHLTQAILDRARAIAQANTPSKRPVEDTDPDSGIGQLARRATNAAQPKGMTLSFVARNPNLHRQPEGHLDDPTQTLDDTNDLYHFPSQWREEVVKHNRRLWLLQLNPRETWQGRDGTVHHPAYDSDEMSSTNASLDSEARQELQIANALHRAEVTVADDISVGQRRAPETVLGLITAAAADADADVNVNAQRWQPEEPSAVRAMDNRSFSNLPLTAVAHWPQSRMGLPSTSQSFFGGMSRLRPSGMSRGQFRRMHSSGTDAAAEMMPQLRLGTVEEVDEEEAEENGDGENVEGSSLLETLVGEEDWDGDSRMTGWDD
ncbi:hypothetical protein PMIN06_009109 [Paraphaeosphaeria minitans]